MKNLKYAILNILLLTVTFSYAQENKASEGTHVSKMILNLIEEGTLSEGAVIVINKNVYDAKSLKESKLQKSDIIAFTVLEKNSDKLVKIYGEKALNGVLFIETKLLDDSTFKIPSSDTVLYIVDGKQVTKKYLDTINPNRIEAINIYKGKKEVAEYTSKEYEGVIVITLKK